MSKVMAVLLNGIAQVEYHRDKQLTEYQQEYLDTMDRKMDSGIVVDGREVENPDQNMRIQFVVANMLNAMKNGDETMTSAFCSYIASRLPDLKQIKIDEDEAGVAIDLVFDEDYSGQAFVTFSSH